MGVRTNFQSSLTKAIVPLPLKRKLSATEPNDLTTAKQKQDKPVENNKRLGQSSFRSSSSQKNKKSRGGPRVVIDEAFDSYSDRSMGFRSLHECLVRTFFHLPADNKNRKRNSLGRQSSSASTYSSSRGTSTVLSASHSSNTKLSQEQRLRRRVVFADESTNSYAESNKESWEEDVLNTWYTPEDLAAMREDAYYEAKHVTAANDSNYEYGRVLHEIFMTLVATNNNPEAKLSNHMQQKLFATLSGDSAIARMGVEQQLAPHLEAELRKRRMTQQTTVRNIQTRSENRGNPDALAAEIARANRRLSRPAQRFAALLAQGYHATE